MSHMGSYYYSAHLREVRLGIFTIASEIILVPSTLRKLPARLPEQQGSTSEATTRPHLSAARHRPMAHRQPNTQLRVRLTSARQAPCTRATPWPAQLLPLCRIRCHRGCNRQGTVGHTPRTVPYITQPTWAAISSGWGYLMGRLILEARKLRHLHDRLADHLGSLRFEIIASKAARKVAQVRQPRDHT